MPTLVLLVLLVPQTSATRVPPTPEPAIAETTWIDLDLDGCPELILVDPRDGLRVLRNLGAAGFEAVDAYIEGEFLATSRAASWEDLDGDGDADLLAVRADGGLALLRNEGALVFRRVDGGSGLEGVQRARSVSCVDFDGDGALDLVVRTDAGVLLERNVGDGRFEPVLEEELTSPRDPLPLAGRAAASESTAPVQDNVEPTRVPVRPFPTGAAPTTQRRESATIAAGPAATATSPIALGCQPALRDATTGSCVQADSTPTLGRLYPLGPELFIDAASGHVGIGTLSPAYALEVAGQVVSGASNSAPGLDAAIGGGRLNTATGKAATVAGGESNLAVGDHATVAGGVGNSAAYRAFVGGGNGNAAGANFAVATGGRTNVASGTYATVGGGANNEASGSYSVVAGGGGDVIPSAGNRALADATTVSGGRDNVAITPGSTVSGGEGNQAGDDALGTGTGATVGGGSGNRALGVGATIGGGTDNLVTGIPNATIAGGRANACAGQEGVIAGGLGNYILGGRNNAIGGGVGNLIHDTANQATIPGGFQNQVAGDNGFAAGWGAQANHHGTFVWSDSTGSFQSTADDQFLVAAGGGVGINTNTPRGTLEAVGSIRASGPGASFTCYNPNNDDATVSLSWLNDVPRLRVGGSGAGASNGLDIQTTGDDSLMRIQGNGDVDVAGSLRTGSLTGLNIEMDASRITASNNGAPSRLTLNRGGGDIVLGESASSRVGVRTASPSFTLEVNGSAGKPGGGSWSVASDRRLKTNVEDLEGALETLLALRGVTFEYRDPEAIGELSGTRIGFVAQEVEAVLPDWVGEREDGYKMLTIRGFEALAVEALRELRLEREAEIERLREAGRRRDVELAVLRAELAALRETVREPLSDPASPAR